MLKIHYTEQDKGRYASAPLCGNAHRSNVATTTPYRSLVTCAKCEATLRLTLGSGNAPEGC